MITSLLEQAIANRASLFDPKHETAFRLFNGFNEGDPNLVIDIYGQTAVIHNYGNASTSESLETIIFQLRNSLDWLHAGIIKHRNASTQEAKRGQLIFGEILDSKINEHGVWYSLALIMNRDASFYLDTSLLRKWLLNHLQRKSVLNTFAYTGSFGVAALAGGASRAVQVDLNHQFLDIAKKSYRLNKIPIKNRDFLAQDFFPAISRFKTGKQSFDCVILDPPFFSSTPKGKVDQVNESARLINKVRPLINDGGYLVAINNAIFVSGKDYLQTLESLCQDGYLEIAELIPVPQSFIGYNLTHKPITDPSPFNHSTKIAILKVKKKQPR